MSCNIESSNMHYVTVFGAELVPVSGHATLHSVATVAVPTVEMAPKMEQLAARNSHNCRNCFAFYDFVYQRDFCQSNFWKVSFIYCFNFSASILVKKVVEQHGIVLCYLQATPRFSTPSATCTKREKGDST